MIVYVVIGFDDEGSDLDSIWSNKDEAESCAQVLNSNKRYYDYVVEPWEVN